MMVSELCFGASRTRDEGLIRYAIDRGMNILDTGRAYANGNNEKLVGRVIRERRKDIIVQSKMYLEESELNFGGKGKKGAAEIKDILSGRLEASLQALDTDYIDIMLYHSAEIEELVYHDEVLKFYDEQKRSGTIRAHGFSSHDYTLNILKRNNREKFYDVIMHPFNFSGSFIHSLSGWSAKWDQEILINELAEAERQGTAIIAMKSCSAGPYSDNGESASFGKSVQWVLGHQFICSAAIAMANFEQIDEHVSFYASSF
jgi:aryl-alcohol dehydrogenase-like predicted oxidoreductase